ncbi:MAG: trypsin-like peptidase domain-containing protein, partial [Chloroflexota bacterium]
MFITAAHCLDGTPNERLWINHHGGPGPDLFSPAQQVEFVREADIAIVVTDAPGAKWVQPFQRVRFYANLGEKVCAFGYPDQALNRDAPAKETPRFFRGTIQRPFHHKSRLAAGAAYSAYELSFPCPSGLSGGPLFLEDDPNTVIGVVTEDLEVGTTLNEEFVEKTSETTTRIDVRRVINYG